MKATIQFKGKLETVYYADNSIAFTGVKIPELKHNHCNMQEFRNHPKYGSYANSDLFVGILRRIKSETFGNSLWAKVGQLPSNVTIDTSGFLAVVTISV